MSLQRGAVIPLLLLLLDVSITTHGHAYADSRLLRAACRRSLVRRYMSGRRTPLAGDGLWGI